jgi:hypothetical protein
MSVEHNSIPSPFSPASNQFTFCLWIWPLYLPHMRKLYSTDLFIFFVSLWFSLGRSCVFRKFVHFMQIIKLFGIQLLIVLSYNPFYFYKIVGSKSQEFLRWNTELNLYSKGKEEEADIPDGWVAGSISKGTYLQGLPWAATDRCISTPAHQNLKSLCRGRNWLPWHMISTTHCSLKAVSVKIVPAVGLMGRLYISRTGEGKRDLQLPESSSQVNW